MVHLACSDLVHVDAFWIWYTIYKALIEETHMEGTDEQVMINRLHNLTKQTKRFSKDEQIIPRLEVPLSLGRKNISFSY